MKKLSFMPKIGEKFYTYTYCGSDIRVIKYIWNNSGINKQRKAFGNVFKTKEEAAAYLPTWKKILQGEEV